LELDKGNAPQIYGGSEPRDIANYSAAQGNHAITALDASFTKKANSILKRFLTTW